MKFEEAVSVVNDLYKKLTLEESTYDIKELTEGILKDMLGSQLPVAGNFLLYEDGVPVYMGRSANLAQRIGTDLRSLGKNQANITKRILEEVPAQYKDMREAREYFYEHYTIKMIKIENEYVRLLLQIYTSMEVETKYNNFLEH